MIGSDLGLLILSPDSCEGCGLCCEGIGSPVLLYSSRPGGVAGAGPTGSPGLCVTGK